MRRDLGALLAILFGTLLFFSSGMNALYWTSTSGVGQVLLRLAALVFGVVLVAFGAVRWADRHSNTVSSTPRHAPIPQFTPYVGSDLRLALEHAIAPMLPQLDVNTLLNLADMTVAPSAYRDRVEETQSISGVTTKVVVRVRLRGLNPGGPCLIPLTRQEKAQSYGVLTVADRGGATLHPLGFIEALGLSYAAALALISTELFGMSSDDRLDVQNKIAQMIGDERDSTWQLQELEACLASTPLWSNPALVDSRTIFLNYMRTVGEKRVVYVGLRDCDQSAEVQYSFTSSHPPACPLPTGFDRWRGLKDRLRDRAHLPAKFVAVSLGRARAVDSYKLHLMVPEGLYVDEAHIFAGGKVMPALRRHVAYRSHIGHSLPNGRADLRVSAWRMGQVGEFSNPQLLVRLTETPPGSVFLSTLVAMGVVVSTWLTGVLTGSALRALGDQSVEPNGDLAALSVAIPGLLVAWLGLAAPSVSSGYRSITALCSLLISASIAVLSIGTYIGRFEIDRIPRALFDDGRSFFFLQDWVSTILLGLALLNFGLVGGLFVARLRRYLTLKRGEHLVLDSEV